MFWPFFLCRPIRDAGPSVAHTNKYQCANNYANDQHCVQERKQERPQVRFGGQDLTKYDCDSNLPTFTHDVAVRGVAASHKYVFEIIKLWRSRCGQTVLTETWWGGRDIPKFSGWGFYTRLPSACGALLGWDPSWLAPRYPKHVWCRPYLTLPSDSQRHTLDINMMRLWLAKIGGRGAREDRIDLVSANG